MSDPVGEIDLDEFAQRLADSLDCDLERAEAMLSLQSQYQWCLGILEGGVSPFPSSNDEQTFREKHGIKGRGSMGTPVYDIEKFETILMADLDLSEDDAQKFSEVEEAYLEDLGLI